MRTNILLLAMGIILATEVSFAGDLAFPTTEQEIISALTLKDGTTEINGVTYVSEKDSVYKVINGKRFKARCIEIINTEIAPKAGAVIRFSSNSSGIHNTSFGLLNRYVRALKGSLADATIQIGGHSDSAGDPEKNMALSRERAESVRQYLVHHGVAENHLVAVPFGDTLPIASNDTLGGRAKNRRVQFTRIE